jgi:hypothetical protein
VQEARLESIHGGGLGGARARAPPTDGDGSDLNSRLHAVSLRLDQTGANAARALAADSPHTSAFTYQGRLRQGGQAAKGVFNLKFRLYDQAVGGNQIGSEIEVPNAQIDDGFFSVDLDFGSVYAEGKRHIEVQVNDTTLAPRQAIMPTPVALYALSGNEGPQGPAGADGAKGDTGDKGDAGADGAAGPMGPQGPAGAEGAAGASGDQGDVGPMGPQGPAGADGAAPNQTIPSTSAVAPSAPRPP